VEVSGLGLISSQAASDSLERKAGRYQIANDVGQKGVGVIADAMTPKLSADIRVQSFVRSQMGRPGGSGIVILKYLAGLTITIGAGLTGSEGAPSGGYKVATITAGTGNVSWA